MSDAASAATPIRFWFDFASPYAYFALNEIEAIGREFSRPVEWRPVLLWAVFKEQGIAAPMDAPSRQNYLLHDMQRSAAFLGLPYTHPQLPISTHLAARLFHSAAQADPNRSKQLAKRIFTAFFTEKVDIRDEAEILRLAGEVGFDAQWTQEAIKGAEGRALLENEVGQAVSAGVIGSPYFMVDGEGFFGADRLPQLRWRLSEKRT